MAQHGKRYNYRGGRPEQAARQAPNSGDGNGIPKQHTDKTQGKQCFQRLVMRMKSRAENEPLGVGITRSVHERAGAVGDGVFKKTSRIVALS